MLISCGGLMTFRQPAAFGQPWPAIVAFAALYGGLIVFVLPKLEAGSGSIREALLGSASTGLRYRVELSDRVMSKLIEMKLLSD